MTLPAVPVVFHAPRSIRRLNVAAVATSIAACTSALAMAVTARGWQWALIAGVPTFFVAWVWALCLRWQRETSNGRRWGWFLSAPLAAMNAGLACGAMFLHDTPSSPSGFFGGVVLGATFGFIVWLPAMCMVLVLFGIPIAHAQRLAQRGLAGEERGERTVGIISAILGAGALALAWNVPIRSIWPESAAAVLGGGVVFNALAITSILCGSLAAVRSTARERRRRRFIARVEALEEPGYRVEPTPAGKVLVRVAPITTYRVSDRAEELFELDDAGRATHSIDPALTSDDRS